MTYRSNAAEALYADNPLHLPPSDLPIDLLPPAELSQSFWKSFSGNFRETFAPSKLPALYLTSRPVDVGRLLSDRLSTPWFRTVFTNIGDVVSPETLPPLELESRPVDVGELITDQLSHFWWTSLLRNLADRVAPERMPALELTAKPIDDIIPHSWLILAMWSETLDGPKIFYPDKPKNEAAKMIDVRTASPQPVAPQALPQDPTASDLLRDIRRSKMRQRIWITLAAAQVAYLIAAVVWPGLF